MKKLHVKAMNLEASKLLFESEILVTKYKRVGEREIEDKTGWVKERWKIKLGG